MARRLDTTIHPIDFRASNYLEHDDAQVIDTDFLTEARDILKMCDDIAEETVGLSTTKFVSDGNTNYLDILGDKFYFPETGLAFSQYAKLLGIPSALARKNPGPLNEQLFSTHTVLKTQKAEKDLLLKYRYNATTKTNELCAVLRGTYQTVRNSQIFEGFVESLGGQVAIDRSMTTIDPFGQCYIRFLSPNFLPTSNNDKIFMAYDLQFSECADTGLILGLGLWRQVCSNGLAIPSMEGGEAYKHPYRGLDPSVPAYVFSRLLKEVVSNDAIGKRLANRRDELMLEQMDLQTSLERLAYNGGSNAFISHIEEKIKQDDTRSQWDLLNDLTQEAQAVPNPRRRRTTEKCVGLTFGFTLAYDSPHKKGRGKHKSELLETESPAFSMEETEV